MDDRPVGYRLVFRCENETGDCSWHAFTYDRIDAHERTPGHWVTGRLEPLAHTPDIPKTPSNLAGGTHV